LHFFTLSFETSVLTMATRRHTAEDSIPRGLIHPWVPEIHRKMFIYDLLHSGYDGDGNVGFVESATVQSCRRSAAEPLNHTASNVYGLFTDNLIPGNEAADASVPHDKVWACSTRGNDDKYTRRFGKESDKLADIRSGCSLRAEHSWTRAGPLSTLQCKVGL
jgi:hypothetical protein